MIARPLMGAHHEAPRFADGKIVLDAEQSTGGKILTTSGGNLIGVTLDRSCEDNFDHKKNARIEWKLDAPLPAGWWHGVIESNFSGGYVNRDLSIMMVGGRNPDVRIAPNYIHAEEGEPQRFEFWIHTSEPTESIRLDPQGDLWRWQKTWPVSRITLEQANPTELKPSDPITLELPVSDDGSVDIPFPLPTGNWFVGGYMTKPGEAVVEGTEGLPIPLSYELDRWKKRRVYSASFHIRSPLNRLEILTKDLFSSVIMRHKATRDKSYDVEGELMQTVDPTRSVVDTLELHGSQLSGGAPTFPVFPEGKDKVVLTSWDDGKSSDLRCAEILIKHGYSPTFMLNGNSPALNFMDQLEAMGAEIGVHGYSHTALNTLTPQAALENITAMRLLLENRLGHPVIAFSYPNGYAPGLDEEGDYVYRAMQESGLWIARTQLTQRQTIEDVDDLLLMRSNGLWGSGNKMLVADWPVFLEQENAVFYLKGHSWQIGNSDEQWQKFDDFVAQFAGHPTAWYPSNNEFALWMWAKENIDISVESSTPDTTIVKLERPWLNPWLAERCPISLDLPAHVTSVTWQGSEIPVTDGRVELSWPQL
ncbi:polysaccharide deacetylase family protein [Puniceicoccus vermicola]|uniref:Polysaccharide deacetylase family protein n=1 Tax=Puniceicoccus vermicola TaxID=388746 RepID=A0A7X1AZF5_9BACT|nr:polysaccharide deacetylase family protein [Puniceicoccus vermicola]MBC2602801.1 polysaccharide deacetylase family protein [Puniceicoccus vermicola]